MRLATRAKAMRRFVALFLAFSFFAPPALADVGDCFAVRRVRRIAQRNNVDPRNLTILEAAVCRFRVASQTPDCEAFLVMEELAQTIEPEPEMLSTIMAARATACAMTSGRAIVEWPDGSRAIVGEGYRYPNGVAALTSSGAWYYPDGTLARNAGGSWRYPNGAALMSGRRPRTPEGRVLSTEGELTTWACSISGMSCLDVVEELPTLPEDAATAASLRVAWRAYQTQQAAR